MNATSPHRNITPNAETMTNPMALWTVAMAWGA
jgi:hypothetical protein